MTALRAAAGLLTSSVLLLGSTTGCGGSDTPGGAGLPTPGASAGTTPGAPAPTTTRQGEGAGTTSTGPASPPEDTKTPGPATPTRRSCGTIGESPTYGLRARGVSCSNARRTQRAWYPAVIAGRSPAGYRCTVGSLAATDVPRSVRCRRGARLVAWSIEPAAKNRAPAPTPDDGGPSTGAADTQAATPASVPQLTRRCGNASAFSAVSYVGSGGCRTAKEVADAFETQYYQGGAERVTTLATHVMDYRCVRTAGRFSASNGYSRFDCTAVRPMDAPSAGVPTKVRFHEFGDL